MGRASAVTMDTGIRKQTSLGEESGVPGISLHVYSFQ